MAGYRCHAARITSASSRSGRPPETSRRRSRRRAASAATARSPCALHCAITDGGICTTLPDLARFGQLYLDGGGGIVPAGLVERVTAADGELVEAFSGSPEAALHPGAMYHDLWWVIDPARDIFVALGIYGQMLLIHRSANAVVAKFSTQRYPSTCRLTISRSRRPSRFATPSWPGRPDGRQPGMIRGCPPPTRGWAEASLQPAPELGTGGTGLNDSLAPGQVRVDHHACPPPAFSDPVFQVRRHLLGL
ncbi:MAG TPA: hypothetical protein VF940_27090 [Streptosporangiaceae bacterium]